MMTRLPSHTRILIAVLVALFIVGVLGLGVVRFLRFVSTGETIH